MSQKDTNTELTLLNRLKRGDGAAFSELYTLYAPGLIRYVFQKTGDLTQAQDIVQDIFTKLWDRRATLSIQTALSAYLYKQALNRCLNALRHERIVAEHALRSLSEFMGIHEDTPDQLLLDRELGEVIRKQIEALAPQMRKTIELRLHMGYSNKEIAERMEVSEHTVATQIKRALRVLRSKIQYVFLIFF